MLKERSKQRQRGMTVIGFLIIAAMVGTIGYGAVRLLPVYLTQFKIQKLMNDLKTEFDGNNATAAQVNSAIGKRLDIDMIYFPTRKDFQIRKSDLGLTVELNYEDRVPFLGNVFLGAEFDNVVEIER